MALSLNTRYDLSLLATISDKSSLVGATLVAVSDSSMAGVSVVIAEYNSKSYALPDALKNRDIYSTTFYHFREAGGGTVVIIPEFFINAQSVKVSASISKTIKLTASSGDELSAALAILSSNNISFTIL